MLFFLACASKAHFWWGCSEAIFNVPIRLNILISLSHLLSILTISVPSPEYDTVMFCGRQEVNSHPIILTKCAYCHIPYATARHGDIYVGICMISIYEPCVIIK